MKRLLALALLAFALLAPVKSVNADGDINHPVIPPTPPPNCQGCRASLDFSGLLVAASVHAQIAANLRP